MARDFATMRATSSGGKQRRGERRQKPDCTHQSRSIRRCTADQRGPAPARARSTWEATRAATAGPGRSARYTSGRRRLYLYLALMGSRWAGRIVSGVRLLRASSTRATARHGLMLQMKCSASKTSPNRSDRTLRRPSCPGWKKRQPAVRLGSTSVAVGFLPPGHTSLISWPRFISILFSPPPSSSGLPSGLGPHRSSVAVGSLDANEVREAGGRAAAADGPRRTIGARTIGARDAPAAGAPHARHFNAGTT